jgi:hypothetical protein
MPVSPRSAFAVPGGSPSRKLDIIGRPGRRRRRRPPEADFRPLSRCDPRAMTTATATTAAPPRRLVMGRPRRYCLLPGFVKCLGRWGCPFRVVERRRKGGRFAGWSVTWQYHGLGRGKPRPPGWKRKPPAFADRWDAQVAALEAFVAWINHPDQSDVVERIRRELRGRDLACRCSGRSPCHADVLLVVANQEAPAEVPMPSFTRPAGRPVPAEVPRAMTTIHVRGLKIASLIPPEALPSDLVPPEPQPAGRAVFEVALEGGGLVVRVECNGKAVRKALKAIAEHGPDGVNLLLQGTLKPPAKPGAPFWLEGAGLSAMPKAAKPSGPSEAS